MQSGWYRGEQGRGWNLPPPAGAAVSRLFDSDGGLAALLLAHYPGFNPGEENPAQITHQLVFEMVHQFQPAFQGKSQVEGAFYTGCDNFPFHFIIFHGLHPGNAISFSFTTGIKSNLTILQYMKKSIREYPETR